MNPQSRISQPDILQPNSDSHPHTHTHHRPTSAPGRLRPSPAHSLLGAGMFARLGLAAAALVLLWTTILWALR